MSGSAMLLALKLRIFVLVCLFSFCLCSSFIGLAKNIDSVAYGVLDIKSGASTLIAEFPVETFNAPQFAYSPSAHLYSFIVYDSGDFNSFLLTLNASDGVVMYNASFPSPPLPFGLAYDTTQGHLYGQVWWPNGTAVLSAINAKTLSMQGVGFSFQPGDWWTYVHSTYSDWNNTYYSLYMSPSSETLVGINVLNGHVSMNVTLGLDTTLGVVTWLQYNTVTNTFYALGFNNATQNYDIAAINQATGTLTYLGVFTNNTLGDVTGMGLDDANNVLSVVYIDGYTTMLVNVDLKAKTIIGSTKLPNNSISTNLVLANL